MSDIKKIAQELLEKIAPGSAIKSACEILQRSVLVESHEATPNWNEYTCHDGSRILIDLYYRVAKAISPHGRHLAQISLAPNPERKKRRHRKRSPRTPERLAMITKLHSEGVSARKIGKAVGVDPTTICRWLRKGIV